MWDHITDLRFITLITEGGDSLTRPMQKDRFVEELQATGPFPKFGGHLSMLLHKDGWISPESSTETSRYCGLPGLGSKGPSSET